MTVDQNPAFRVRAQQSDRQVRQRSLAKPVGPTVNRFAVTNRRVDVPAKPIDRLAQRCAGNAIERDARAKVRARPFAGYLLPITASHWQVVVMQAPTD